MRTGEPQTGIKDNGDIGVSAIVFMGGVGRNVLPRQNPRVESALFDEERLVRLRLMAELLVATGSIDKARVGSGLAQCWLCVAGVKTINRTWRDD